MDKASDYESGDCRFESCQDQHIFCRRNKITKLKHFNVLSGCTLIYSCIHLSPGKNHLFCAVNKNIYSTQKQCPFAQCLTIVILMVMALNNFQVSRTDIWGTLLVTTTTTSN